MTDHEPTCPQAQAWDHGEWEAPCTCATPEDTALALSLIGRFGSRTPRLDVEGMRALLRQQRAQNPGRTHWAGCETEHVVCALDAALDEIDRLRAREEEHP